ncbi:MAG: hypothetical protein WAU25_12460 [Nitrososphaeraceae archaeon]|jgi:hypothetical protein
MKTFGAVVVIVAVTISFGLITNVSGQEQQNVTETIMDQTSDIPQCSLVEQARGLGLDTSLFSNVTEFNACLQVIYESPDRIVLTGDLITSGGEYNSGIWKAIDGLETAAWSVENVLITGEGSKANPHSYVITMTK